MNDKKNNLTQFETYHLRNRRTNRITTIGRVYQNRFYFHPDFLKKSKYFEKLKKCESYEIKCYDDKTLTINEMTKIMEKYFLKKPNKNWINEMRECEYVDPIMFDGGDKELRKKYPLIKNASEITCKDGFFALDKNDRAYEFKTDAKYDLKYDARTEKFSVFLEKENERKVPYIVFNEEEFLKRFKRNSLVLLNGPFHNCEVKRLNKDLYIKINGIEQIWAKEKDFIEYELIEDRKIFIIHTDFKDIQMSSKEFVNFFNE